MAFHGRGSGPSFGNRGPRGGNNSGESKGNFYHYFYYHHYHRPYIIVYDKTFMLMEIIATAIILIGCIMAYLFSYQPSFPDPIQSVKDTYLISQGIVLGCMVVFLILASFFTEEKEKLEKRLKVILIISCISLVVLFGIRIYLDGIYTTEKFETFYETTDFEGKNESFSGNGISLKNMSIATQKELYVEENLRTYQFFQIKTLMLIVLQILLNILLGYFILRVRKHNQKKDQLEKDDAILYDEEENVKI